MHGAFLLTVCLGLPDGVTEPQAAGHDVEVGDVVGFGLPEGQHDQQPRVEGGPCRDEGEALDVARHVADGQGGHGAAGPEADENGSDVLEAQRAAHVRLKQTMGIPDENRSD